MSIKVHPCMQCGACCAFFRVSFSNFQHENFETWKVPLQYTQSTPVKSATKQGPEDAEPSQVTYSMIGTDKKHRPKCELLKGKIGVLATCQIYSCRPTPCREFSASFIDGHKNLRCDEARKAHGLAPLTRVDWFEYFRESPEKVCSMP